MFGVEIYRRTYIDAVNNGWLSDYRIIAIGVNDPESYRAANMLAKNTQSKGRQGLTTDHYIRGLAFALAMGNATQQDNDSQEQVAIQSCIAFMNTVDKSKNMAKDLQSDTAREWIQKYLNDNLPGRQAAQYEFEHLDASSNVLLRDQAKGKLAQATSEHPHGILNVGIFGEGTDSPSLSAVAFLEARKSPIDVIQAVGRAMRTAPGKEMGYIICPIVIPPQADPEEWLQTSSKEDGWKELGQILLALRAHDERIEDQLSKLMTLYIPPAQEVVATAVSVANQETGYIRHHYHVGPVRRGSKSRRTGRGAQGPPPRRGTASPQRTADAGQGRARGLRGNQVRSRHAGSATFSGAGDNYNQRGRSTAEIVRPATRINRGTSGEINAGQCYCQRHLYHADDASER